MKKIAFKKKVGITLVTIILVIVGYFVWLTTMLVRTDLWKYNADFDNHKEAFETVKDYVLDGGYDKNGILGVERSEYHFHDLYDHLTRQYLNCPDEIKDMLEEISKEAFYFKDSEFDSIRCQDGVVKFCIANGQYMLVYSPNGNPRNLIKESLSSDEYSVITKKIEKNWYHIRIQK